MATDNTGEHTMNHDKSFEVGQEVMVEGRISMRHGPGHKWWVSTSMGQCLLVPEDVIWPVYDEVDEPPVSEIEVERALRETLDGYPSLGELIAFLKGRTPDPDEGVKTDQGTKHDTGKPDWSLLDLDVVEGMVRVLDFGAKKYGRDNWMRLGDGPRRYFAAALRHLTAWQGGEENDPESGLPHLAHAACCLHFIQALER